MGDRLRLLGVLGVVLLIGILIGSGGAQWFVPRVGSARPPQASTAVLPRIRVEVLNAGGRSGMARHARELLLERGVDVVYYGNDRSFGIDTSEVVLRSGSEENAQRVARLLGIAPVREELDSALYLDVTVRLGSDWDPSRVPETEVDSRSDLRAVSPGRNPGTRR